MNRRLLLLVLAALLPVAMLPSRPALAEMSPVLMVETLPNGVRLTLTTPAPLPAADGWVVPGLAGTRDPITGLPLLLVPIRLPAPLTPTLALGEGDVDRLNGSEPAATAQLPTAQVYRMLVARDAALAVIALAPLQWDGQQLTHRARLTVDLTFANLAPDVLASGSAELPELTALLDAAALNRLPAASSVLPVRRAATSAQQSNPPDLLLSIAEPGLVRLSGADLAAVGWPMDSILMSALRLSFQGEPLAFQASTSVLDALTASTIISFSLTPGWSRYSDAIGLRLSVDPTAQALRADPLTTTPFVFGQPALYVSSQPGPALEGRAGDYFYAARLTADTPTATLVFTLPEALPAGTLLELGLQAEQPDDLPAIKIQIDDAPLSSSQWSAADSSLVELALPALAAGPHTLSLTLTSAGDLLVDRGRIAALQLPLPVQPARIRVAPPTLDQVPDPAVSAVDLLIVTHSTFRPALDPLLSLHRGQGRRVAVVDVEEMYAAYGDGNLDPEAIRRYLKAAAPGAVLLVGDGTWDFKNQLGQPGRTFIPPYLERIDGKLGEAACDTCYVRWSSERPGDDLMPDALIGRLSVETPEQAHLLVAKLVGYATAPPVGGWRGRLLTVADNSFERDGTPDKTVIPGHLSFDQAGETLAALLPTGKRSQPFYFDPRPASNGQAGRYGDARRLRADLLGAWNRGAAVVSYIGHANYFQWGVTDSQAGVPYLFYHGDAAGLQNGERLPLLLGLTCLSGLFQEPSRPTTDEMLLRHQYGGIIGSIASSGLGVATGHDYLQAGMIPALLHEQRSFGAVQLAGFVELLTHGGCCADLAYTYQLLGDPLLTLPEGSAGSYGFLPFIRRQ